jgi:hypothetical protein
LICWRPWRFSLVTSSDHLDRLSLDSCDASPCFNSPFVCQDTAAGCHTARDLPVSASPSGQPSAGLFLWGGDPMTADERRLLELLAATEDGCTDALLLAHGFTLEVIFNVVKAGLATIQAERLHAASQPIEIVRITDAGLRIRAEQQG